MISTMLNAPSTTPTLAQNLNDNKEMEITLNHMGECGTFALNSPCPSTTHAEEPTPCKMLFGVMILMELTSERSIHSQLETSCWHVFFYQSLPFKYFQKYTKYLSKRNCRSRQVIFWLLQA